MGTPEPQTESQASGRTGVEQMQTQAPSSWGGAVTVHHLNRDVFDSDREYVNTQSDFRMGRREVDQDDVDELYRPVETVVGTTDLSEAFRRAQGEVVNRQQNGRHGVPSAHVSNVFEVIHPNGDREYHFVETIGFSKISNDVDGG